jgi:hypothetical protein
VGDALAQCGGGGSPDRLLAMAQPALAALLETEGDGGSGSDSGVTQYLCAVAASVVLVRLLLLPLSVCCDATADGGAQYPPVSAAVVAAARLLASAAARLLASAAADCVLRRVPALTAAEGRDAAALAALLRPAADACRLTLGSDRGPVTVHALALAHIHSAVQGGVGEAAAECVLRFLLFSLSDALSRQGAASAGDWEGTAALSQT